jgi:hypothetical protein
LIRLLVVQTSVSGPTGRCPASPMIVNPVERWAPEARRLLRVGKEGVGDAIVSSAFGLGRHTLDGSR